MPARKIENMALHERLAAFRKAWKEHVAAGLDPSQLEAERLAGAYKIEPPVGLSLLAFYKIWREHVNAGFVASSEEAAHIAKRLGITPAPGVPIPGSLYFGVNPARKKTRK